MKTKKVFHREKIIAIVSLISLINFIFPQPVKSHILVENGGKQSFVNYGSMEQIMALPSLPEIKTREAKNYFYLTVTAYSSSPDECSGNPFITASGERVNDGTLAYNYLPFGSKIRFPEVYGEKIFTVTDRMAAYKGKYIADIWMPSKAEAIQWGVKVIKMEII